MAITFYMVKDIQAIMSMKDEDALNFDEELYDFLCKNNPSRLGTVTLPLLGLDPYGDPKILHTNEIKEIIDICGIFIDEYQEKEVHNFCNHLIELCNKALDNKKKIVVVGD